MQLSSIHMQRVSILGLWFVVGQGVVGSCIDTCGGRDDRSCRLTIVAVEYDVVKSSFHSTTNHLAHQPVLALLQPTLLALARSRATVLALARIAHSFSKTTSMLLCQNGFVIFCMLCSLFKCSLGNETGEAYY